MAMELVVPWAELASRTEPYVPEDGRRVDCPGLVDKPQPQAEARSNASGLMPPRWL